jgi:transcriptional regulator with XRE-family HTH domain
MAQNQTPPWKAMREATGLSQREIARRTQINSGRLSIIERGVVPTDEEAARLRSVLGELLTKKGEEVA